jgi:hypothetical protein
LPIDITYLRQIYYGHKIVENRSWNICERKYAFLRSNKSVDAQLSHRKTYGIVALVAFIGPAAATDPGYQLRAEKGKNKLPWKFHAKFEVLWRISDPWVRPLFTQAMEDSCKRGKKQGRLYHKEPNNDYLFYICNDHPPTPAQLKELSIASGAPQYQYAREDPDFTQNTGRYRIWTAGASSDV